MGLKEASVAASSTPGSVATTQSARTRRWREALGRVEALAEQVATLGACSLPGVSIAFELLAPLIQRAVRRGFVLVEHADFVLDGLRFGFRLGIDVDRLQGKRWYRNCPRSMWPSWPCREHGGSGWEARIIDHRRGADRSNAMRHEVRIVFVGSSQRRFGPMWVVLQALRPL